MADSTLTALPAAGALAGADLFYAVQSGADVKVTATQIQTFTGGGGTTYTVTFSGNVSAAAWTTTGIGLVGAAASFTDTSSSGTVATMYVHRLGIPTILASSSTTYTAAYGLWVEPPTASTNVTISNGYAFGTGGKFVTTFNTSPGLAFGIVASGQNPVGISRNTSVGGLSLHGGGAVTPGDGNATIIVQGANASTPIVVMDAATQFGWASSATTQPLDLLLKRAAAATLQQGAADVDTGAAIVAQTFRTQGALAGGTSDQSGKDFTIAVSPSKGTGAGGNFVNQTSISAKSTGTSIGSFVDRNIVVAKGKVLTSAAAFSMFDVALPTLTMCGGVIEATIICTDGTDMQSFTQTVTYSAVNKGGVYTTSITPSTGDKSVSAGTLTTSWTVVSGTNKVTIKVTPTTSLTPSANSFLLYYIIRNNSEQLTTIL